MRQLAPLLLIGLACCGGSSHGSSSGGTSGGGTSGGGSSSSNPGVSTAADNGDVGTWSQRYLQASPYSSLLVEVDYLSSVTPTQAALATLQTRLEAHLNKPGGVQIVTHVVDAPGQATWSVQQCYDLEQEARLYYANGSQAVKYYLYVDGHSSEDTASESVVGWTYTGTSTTMFAQTLQSVTSVLVSLQSVEQSVLVHEAGHDLGLVNLGCPLTSNHLDTAHGPHCTNDDCVMYYAVEAGNPQIVFENRGTLPDDFDAACVADLQANGGK